MKQQNWLKLLSYSFFILIGFFLGLNFQKTFYETTSKNQNTQDKTTVFPTPKPDNSLFFIAKDYEQISEQSEKYQQAKILYDLEYRPIPSLEVSFDEYSNENKPLPRVKTDQEIFADDFLSAVKEEQIQEHGQLARRFLPDEYIGEVERHDVDGDGEEELLVETYFLGASYTRGHVYVVKDDQIIFSTTDLQTEVEPLRFNYGFDINWYDFRKASCCPYGYQKIRFLWKNGEFVPAFEQDVRYLMVDEEENLWWLEQKKN